VLFRWDAPLLFANAELFHDRLLAAVAESPTPVRWVVVAAEPVTSVDVTSADMLVELDDALHAMGIELAFAEMKGPVKDRPARPGAPGLRTGGEAGQAMMLTPPSTYSVSPDRRRAYGVAR
jgi:MFS superfamily sulfate permease-like transporter